MIPPTIPPAIRGVLFRLADWGSGEAKLDSIGDDPMSVVVVMVVVEVPFDLREHWP